MLRPFVTGCAALSLALAVPTAAQEAQVHAAGPIAIVSAFMSAFDAKDGEAMEAMLVPETTVAMVEERDGPDRVQFTTMAALLETLAQLPAGVEEPIWNIRGFEDGPVAVVTADFEFLVDGNRSHCGVNIFTLMRVNGEWKIATVTYSHITEGCDADA